MATLQPAQEVLAAHVGSSGNGGAKAPLRMPVRHSPQGCLLLLHLLLLLLLSLLLPLLLLLLQRGPRVRWVLLHSPLACCFHRQRLALVSDRAAHCL